MKFNLQPYLESDLVVLKPLRPSDFNRLYRTASDPLIWEQHQNKDRHTLEVFTLYFKDSITSGGALSITDKASGKIIGSSRFKIINKKEGVVEIGWTFLNRNYWGGTYNGEIKKLMVNHVLENAKKAVFYVHENNFRSQGALEKLGANKMSYSSTSWVLEKGAGITYMISKKISDSV